VKNQTFIAAINCIDGRVQKPVIEFAIDKFKVDYVDMITEPGPDKILSENKALDIIESIKKRVLISVEKHNSKIILVVGHHDCAGNAVGEAQHRSQIKEAVKNIKNWDLAVDVCGVWVDENWVCYEVEREVKT